MSRSPERRARWPLCLLLLGALVSATPAQDSRALKALEQWLVMYQSGKLDLAKKRINKTSPGVRADIVSPERASGIGHLEELDSICRVVEAIGTADAAERLLAVAAVGLDRKSAGDVERRPHAVRRIGEQWLDRADEPAMITLLEAAAADEGATKGPAVARRAAALRALGRRKQDQQVFRFETAFAAAEPEVRLAAAEACGLSESKLALRPLVAALPREADEAVLVAGFVSVLQIVAVHREGLDEDLLRRAADAATNALGRGTWRVDLAAVQLLEKLRTATSVPVLIDVLARFEPGSAAREEQVSGLLKEATVDALVSLTGARFPAERADQWRGWWEQVKEGFEVAKVPESAARSDEGRTVTSDFFGIPVRGNRVLFVVDCSGSMAEPWRGEAGATRSRPGGDGTKIDVAKRELLAAVGRLTADCQFNLVWFGNGAKCWQRDMVPADEKNKKKFESQVEELRADGGTNLWQGLQDGLKLESLVYGSRYATSYDQVFILSDGVPTLGDVQDPKEILLLVRETNRYSRLRIDTIYISGDPRAERRAAEIKGMSGADLMRALAEQNGGTSIAF